MENRQTRSQTIINNFLKWEKKNIAKDDLWNTFIKPLLGFLIISLIFIFLFFVPSPPLSISLFILLLILFWHPKTEL